MLKAFSFFFVSFWIFFSSFSMLSRASRDGISRGSDTSDEEFEFELELELELLTEEMLLRRLSLPD
jgi:hypothetical protein